MQVPKRPGQPAKSGYDEAASAQSIGFCIQVADPVLHLE